MFDAVKTVLKCGGSVTEVSKFMKLSWDVVKMIDSSETLEEYRQTMYARNQKKLEQKQVAAIKAKEKEKESVPQIVETRQTVQITATHYMAEEMRKTNELLKLISNKLAFIVDELCGVKTDAKQDH